MGTGDPKSSGNHAGGRRSRGANATAQHNAHEIGGIAGADFLHDARAMHLDGARADAEPAAGLFVRGTSRDLSQHFAFPRRQQCLAGKLGPPAVVAVSMGTRFLKAEIAPATRMTIERASNGLTR